MPDVNKREVDEEASPELLAKIQGHLDKVPDTTEEDLLDIPQKEEKERDVTDDEVALGIEDIKDTEDEDLDENLDKDEDDDKKGKEDEVTLPENYYRAAVHSDWTSEEIQGFFKTNPELALKTFKKIYDSTNVATNEFVELGRANQKQLQEAEAAEQAKKDAEANKFKGMDIDAVAEQFKDEPAVVALLKAANEQNRTLHEQFTELKKSQTQIAQTGLSDEDTRIWNDINGFFDDKGLEAFGEFYGKSEKDKYWDQVLTGEQMRNRHQVIVMADQISAGAKLAGREMDRSEALRRAHLAASDSVRETVIRNELKDKAKKRSKGITVKSTGRKTQDDTTSVQKSEKTALGNAAKRLKKVFGGHVE
jgi:hypothetical protein